VLVIKANFDKPADLSKMLEKIEEILSSPPV
jgi:hypothetical protein